MSNQLCPLCRRPIRPLEQLAYTGAHLRCYVRALEREHRIRAGTWQRVPQHGPDPATREPYLQGRPVCAVCGKQIESDEERFRLGLANVHLACQQVNADTRRVAAGVP